MAALDFPVVSDIFNQAIRDEAVLLNLNNDH
jgi:hypothetical protein